MSPVISSNLYIFQPPTGQGNRQGANPPPLACGDQMAWLPMKKSIPVLLGGMVPKQLMLKGF